MTIEYDGVEHSDGCKRLLDRCTKLISLLDSRTIDFGESAYNMTIRLIQVCDACRQGFVHGLPDEYLLPYRSFLKEYLIPSDFLPNPDAFVAGEGRPGERDQVKAKHRPRYRRLFEQVRDRLPAEDASAGDPATG